MQDFFVSVGCLICVWGLPILTAGLVVKLVIEVRQGRARREAEVTRREPPNDNIWPPPPEGP